MLDLILNNNQTNQNSEIFEESNLKSELAKFSKTINSEHVGFYNLTSQKNYIEENKKIYNQFSHKKTFVHIGMGGSSLGPKMLIDALNKSDNLFIFLENIDSDSIFHQLKQIKNIKDSLFYIVSKSGGTAETVAIYLVIRNWLEEKGIDQSEFKNYFVFCTDIDSGDFRTHIKENDFYSLSVPKNVGGRFSVLSSVGLLPSLFAGINVEELYAGAEDLKANLLETEIDKNILLKSASQIFYYFKEKNIDQTVLMPYSTRIKSFSQWFVQLWAESLGKIQYNSKLNTGLTPIPAYGATDQHSQMQLFMQGPNDKLIIFIENEKPEHDYKLNNTLDLPSTKKLAPFSLNDLLSAELHGTLQALSEQGRMYLHLKIAKIDEYHLGQLILFFESLTVLIAQYLKVDPFDQPGVEAGKAKAIQLLENS